MGPSACFPNLPLCYWFAWPNVRWTHKPLLFSPAPSQSFIASDQKNSTMQGFDTCARFELVAHVRNVAVECQPELANGSDLLLSPASLVNMPAVRNASSEEELEAIMQEANGSTPVQCVRLNSVLFGIGSARESSFAPTYSAGQRI